MMVRVSREGLGVTYRLIQEQGAIGAYYHRSGTYRVS